MEKDSVQSYQEYHEDQFTKRVIFNNEHSTAFVLNFMPGQQLPAHHHPGADVYLLVIAGSGIFIIDGEETDVKQGDAVYTSDQEQLSFKNSGSEPVSLYVVISKLPSQAYAQNI